MATAAIAAEIDSQLTVSEFGVFFGLRVLAWHNDHLYASRGYELLRARIIPGSEIRWEQVACATAPWWRAVSSSFRWTARLCRDGFHALAILESGELVAAIPNAIVTLVPHEEEFRVTHRVERGTRPLHIAATPEGHVFWGEYFHNPDRGEVHIYGSSDRGAHWDVAYTFPRGAIRHVHNVVYDPWENCLWVLTGDNGAECRIIRASCDFSDVQVVLFGNQQTRCVALVPTRDAIYFATDTPHEENNVYRLDRRGNFERLGQLSSSSISGCRVGGNVFFSTMIEPSSVNFERNVRIYGTGDGRRFTSLAHWPKDSWPMNLFQYGNAVFPDGNNTTDVLAATTIAVKGADFTTTLWQVSQ